MTEHRAKVLIIDEDTGFLEEAATELSGHFTVYTSATGGNGLKAFAQLRPQVVIVDAGISDIPFPSLLDDLKGLDGAVLRIATSQDYSAIEKVVQAIDTGHIHKYFRKPVNYFDLIEIINARRVSYHVGRDASPGAEVTQAYEKLHNIMDKAKEIEKLRQQLESQMAKIKDVEAESFNKVKDALGEVNTFRKKIADKEAVIGGLQAKNLELEELKKRDIERVERERAALRQELENMKGEKDKLLGEKAEFERLKATHEKLRMEEEKLRAENDDLRASVPREREKMIEEMTRERKTLAEELARKRDEAERVVEVQKERNKAELQKVHDAFEEEKQRAVREIERLKAQFEENHKAKMAEIEQERKLAEADLEEFRRQEALEKAAIEKSMGEDKQRAAQEISRLKASFNEAYRKAKLAEIEADRKRVEQELNKRVEEELARRKYEAEHIVEMQKERNKAELQALQDAFEEEKRHAARKIEQERKLAQADLEEFRRQQAAEKAAIEKSLEEEKHRAVREIERLKAEFEEDRKAKLAEIEEDRKRGEQELAGIRARMTEEKEQLEKSVQEQREKAEADVRRFREAAAMEQKKLTEALEVKLAAMKKAAEAEAEELRALATREIDRFKVAAQKKERELSEALIQARRMAGETVDQLKLTEGRIKALESEIEKNLNEKNLVLQELASVRADFNWAIQSREALVAEVAELRNMLK